MRQRAALQHAEVGAPAILQNQTTVWMLPGFEDRLSCRTCKMRFRRLASSFFVLGGDAKILQWRDDRRINFLVVERAAWPAAHSFRLLR